MEGAATGFYLVTIGEGRRLAQFLRVKRKEIKKTEPIRCVIDTANDPHEISLDDCCRRNVLPPRPFALTDDKIVLGELGAIRLAGTRQTRHSVSRVGW